VESALFYVFGALMLAGAVLTVTSRSAVNAAVWLVFSFVCASGIFALLSAPFLAILQILIYAGAIMVLFLFVIMMLQGPELKDERARRSPLTLAVQVLPAGALAVTLLAWLARGGGAGFGGAAAVTGTAEAVASLLLNRYLLAFEVISLVLLVAIIGALSLGRKEEDKPWR